MNEKRIGEAAGIVWKHLSESESPLTLAALKKSSGLKADEVAAAIGWLAREGKLAFETERRRTLIMLAERAFASV